VATTLNNLAILHSEQNNNDEALKEYEEALQIYRALAETNPNTYMPDVAMTLNNLAVLHKNQNNNDEALKEYEEALQIRYSFAESNPQVYKIDIAQSNYNLAILYQDKLPNREKSIQYVLETIVILLEIADVVIYIQKYLEFAMNILRGWNLNDEEIEQLIAEKMKEAEENKS
jgi:tetratricopeptide (TPR) repeat protein